MHWSESLYTEGSQSDSMSGMKMHGIIGMMSEWRSTRTPETKAR